MHVKCVSLQEQAADPIFILLQLCAGSCRPKPLIAPQLLQVRLLASAHMTPHASIIFVHAHNAHDMHISQSPLPFASQWPGRCGGALPLVRHHSTACVTAAGAGPDLDRLDAAAAAALEASDDDSQPPAEAAASEASDADAAEDDGLATAGDELQDALRALPLGAALHPMLYSGASDPV